MATSNTTGMQRHLEKKHSKEFDVFEKEKSALIQAKKDKGGKSLKRSSTDINSNCGPKMKQTRFSFMRKRPDCLRL